MINVVVTGMCGRMGHMIASMVVSSSGFNLVGATEAPGHSCLGRDLGELLGLKKVNTKLTENLDEVIRQSDVVIDFTAPEASLQHLSTCVAHGKGIVIGTTGFKKAEVSVVREKTKNIACVLAPNMSAGVNLLFHLVERAAAGLGNDYDVEIVEAHHRYKKDAPSGTALKLAQTIAKVLGREWEKAGIYGRKGLTDGRTEEEIAVHSVRAGDIVGEHTVIFGGLGERLEMVHRAHSRDTFARGALRAACFVARAKPGLYDMEDVLGLK